MSDQGVQQGQEVSQEEQYVEQAQTWLASFGEGVQQLTEANKSLLEAGDHEYTFTGWMTFKDVLVYCRVEGEAFVNDGTHLQFEGDAYGVGVGIGASMGGGSFGYLSPDEVVGDCSFEVHNGGLGPGMCQVTWWRGSKCLGTFLGGGLALAIGVFGGKGKWKYATEES